jgi:hypothetical protein
MMQMKSYYLCYFACRTHGNVLCLIECRALDKTISNLEMDLAAARAVQESVRSGAPVSEDIRTTESSGKRKYLMVVGINTAFSSRKRRDSVRATWLPQGS